MAGVGRIDDAVKGVDQAGRVIAGLIQDALQRSGGSAGSHWGTMEKGRSLAGYPYTAMLRRETPAQYMPEAGTEIFSVNPHELLGELAYPGDLAREARKRLVGSPYQTPLQGRLDWLYLRPGTTTVPNTPGRATVRMPRDPSEGSATAVYDVAGGRDDAIRTLLHELRHGTNTREMFLKRASPSVSGAYRSSFSTESPRGPMLSQEFQRYLARPTEILSYVAEAGDDFVGANKRLVESPADADQAMEMWVENSQAMADPMVKGFYSRAYDSSPTVKKVIQDMLRRYYAVPVAAGAASAVQDE